MVNTLKNGQVIERLFEKLPIGHPNDDYIRGLLLEFILREWVVEKGLWRNGYNLSIELGEYKGGLVDPTSPEYVSFVQGLKKDINILSQSLKVINQYVRYQYLNEWVKYGSGISENVNFHKILVVIRRQIVSEYQYLLKTRVFWKKMYKFQRGCYLKEREPDVLYA